MIKKICLICVVLLCTGTMVSADPIYVKGNYAFVVGNDQFVIFDISDPDNIFPIEDDFFPVMVAGATDVVISGTNALIRTVTIGADEQIVVGMAIEDVSSYVDENDDGTDDGSSDDDGTDDGSTDDDGTDDGSTDDDGTDDGSTDDDGTDDGSTDDDGTDDGSTDDDGTDDGSTDDDGTDDGSTDDDGTDDGSTDDDQDQDGCDFSMFAALYDSHKGVLTIPYAFILGDDSEMMYQLIMTQRGSSNNWEISFVEEVTED